MHAAARHTWTVSADDAAARLDAQLAAALDVSRQHARRLLAAGYVRVNDRAVTERDKGSLVHPGDRLDVVAVTFEPVPRPDLPLTVLQQGDDFIVVDKPPGVPVHPLAPDETDTVLNALVARFPQISGVGEGELRSGVVHRLDVETSGCLAFALTQPRYDALRDAFRTHRIKKTYHALVAGRLEGERTETLDLYVARHKPALVKVAPPKPADAKLRRNQAPAHPDARPCTLTWCTVKAADHATLLEIDLATGHLHQIRATLAHLGHPVLGDPTYGDATTAPRLMLHATRLQDGEIDAESPVPPAFQR